MSGGRARGGRCAADRRMTAATVRDYRRRMAAELRATAARSKSTKRRAMLEDLVRLMAGDVRE